MIGLNGVLTRCVRAVLIVSVVALAGCKMDDVDTAHALVTEMAHPGKLIHFASGQTCTAAVYQARAGEAKFNVPITDSARVALKHAEAKNAIAFDNSEISPNDFTSQAASDKAPAAMRLIAAGTAALKCMPDEMQALYFAALTTPTSVIVIDMKNTALAIVDRMTGYLFLVRGDL